MPPAIAQGQGRGGYRVELQGRPLVDQILFRRPLLELRGDPEKDKRNVFRPPSISERVDRIAGSQWYTTSAPTGTNRDDYRWASEAFTAEQVRLRALFKDLVALEAKFEGWAGDIRESDSLLPAYWKIDYVRYYRRNPQAPQIPSLQS